jgi:hypothetical protein
MNSWHLFGECRRGDDNRAKVALFKALIAQHGGELDDGSLSVVSEERAEICARFPRLPVEHAHIREQLEQAGFDVHLIQPR